MRLRSIVRTTAITTVAGALSLAMGGAVHAESTAQVEQTSVIEVTGTGTTTLTQEQTSTTTVTENGTEVVESESTTTGFQSDEATPTDTGTFQPVTSTTDNSQPSAPLASSSGHDESLVSPVGEATTGGPTPDLTTTRHYLVQFSSENNEVSTPQPAIASTDPRVPSGSANEPHNQPVSGAMQQINSALASLVLPSWRPLLGTGHPLAFIMLTLSFALILLLGRSLAKISSVFISRLRRTGYNHAARSDVSSAFLSFVTPLKVSFAWAPSPAASSSFYGGRSRSVASG
jgi:hypothetical protein